MGEWQIIDLELSCSLHTDNWDLLSDQISPEYLSFEYLSFDIAEEYEERLGLVSASVPNNSSAIFSQNIIMPT